MKLVLSVVVVALALVVGQARAQCGGCGGGSSCGSKAVAEAEVVEPGVINPAGVSALIKAKVPMVILDARSGKYDDGTRIPGALSLNAGSSPEEIAKVIPEKSSLIITYCASPTCPASDKLAKHLISLGYTNILEMPLGIKGWIADGRAVETAG